MSRQGRCETTRSWWWHRAYGTAKIEKSHAYKRPPTCIMLYSTGIVSIVKRSRMTLGPIPFPPLMHMHGTIGGGRGYDNSVPGEVTKTAPCG